MFCGTNKMIEPEKSKVIVYCPKGHGIFPVLSFAEGTPKCPVCGENLLKMEGVVTK